MARSFAITTTATDTLKADAQGHAQAVFTVTNTTSRPIRGMAKVKALGDTKREWLDIEGETERDFAAGATQQFTVNFDAKPDISASAAAPVAGVAGATGGKMASAAPSAPPGKYRFRLDVASALNSDEDFTEGPEVTVEVAAAAQPVKKPFPFWIIPVIVGVLLIIGLVLFFVLRSKGGGGNDNEVVEASPSPTASPSVAPAAPFAGKWVNTNPNTGGNTRFEITQNGTQLQVHAWGKCHPQDCDWGTQNGAVINGEGNVTWDEGYAIIKMVITLEGSNQIRVVSDTVFNDSRPRLHTDETFKHEFIVRPRQEVVTQPQPLRTQ